MPDNLAEQRRMSSSHASSSAGQGHSGVPPYPGALPPKGPDQHQSRSKRLASKLLKKMGTKERFRHPASESSAAGAWSLFKASVMHLL